MKQKIYLMKNDFGLHKIGISLNPKKRAMEVSNSSGVPTEVVSVWESYNAYATEQRLHKHFSAKRKSGEWFKFTKKDISEVGKCIPEFDKIIPCKVDYTTKPAPKPVCQDLKFVLLMKNKNIRTVEDIADVMKFQHSLLNPLFRFRREEYNDLISNMKKGGFHMEYRWLHDDPSTSTPLGDLYRPYCTSFSQTYPICTEKDRIRMEIIYKESQIEHYREETLKLTSRVNELKNLLSEEK